MKHSETSSTKLSDDRNLKDFHLKHYQMSTAQSKNMTTHLDIPGRTYDLYQHVVKTCPFCNSVKPRCCRVSGLRAEEFGDLIFMDHGSANIRGKTFGFLIVLGGATQHVHVREPLHRKESLSILGGWTPSR